MYEASSDGGGDRRIAQLKAHVAAMAKLASEMVADGTRALRANDDGLAQHVIDLDEALDRFDVETESETIRLIAVLQPEGADLRTLGALLKIGTCVDRIGRLGYDIARLHGPAPEPPDPTVGELLGRMEGKARQMFERAIAAFVDHDAVRAKSVFALDDEVDAIHREVQSRIVADLERGGPSAPRLAAMLLAARHLERVGDNACKIAEKTVYAVTGERRPEYFPARHRAAGRPAGPPGTLPTGDGPAPAP